eukprot:1871799-Pyramimonas_sp.AAC.1
MPGVGARHRQGERICREWEPVTGRERVYAGSECTPTANQHWLRSEVMGPRGVCVCAPPLMVTSPPSDSELDASDGELNPL